MYNWREVSYKMSVELDHSNVQKLKKEDFGVLAVWKLTIVTNSAMRLLRKSNVLSIPPMSEGIQNKWG